MWGLLFRNLIEVGKKFVYIGIKYLLIVKEGGFYCLECVLINWVMGLLWW